jgi:ATP-dependent Clp protease adaptor protein ClpS
MIKAVGTDVKTQTKPQTRTPAMYKVLLLNDDYTPMDFVVEILIRFFRKNETEAVTIMLQVHQAGVGLCGVYTHEIAETKVAQVVGAAEAAGYPLQAIMEPE